MQRAAEVRESSSLLSLNAIHDSFANGLLSRAPPWMISAAGHMFLFLVAALIPYKLASRSESNAHQFEAFEQNNAEQMELTQNFEVGDPPLEPSELNTETLMEWKAEPKAQEAQFNDDNPIFEERGGGIATGTETGAGLGFDLRASGLGPVLSGGGGVDIGLGTGTQGGRGGFSSGFGLRGTGNREAIPGVTKVSERAVAAALNWISRHQNKDGGWTLDLGDGKHCNDKTCVGLGGTQADAGATALAILPFLGAGQTQDEKGPYQKNVQRGLQWLISHQRSNGDLSGGHHQMYSHAIATMALCEAYGMTKDSRVGHPAQEAIRFIESGQNAQGGWRYRHAGYEGDTSVFGWQVMALKSAQMAGLEVDQGKFKRCKNWLDSCSSGYQNGKFSYMPGQGWRPSMTAVGLLGLQYLGAKRNDRDVREAVETLMQSKPTLDDKDIYYWYYATLALHNAPGPEWDTWNRQIRKILIETQSKKGCSAGSWSPTDDAWGTHGGRLMMTSLSALTLEVYYRYLPLYKLSDAESGAAEKPEEPVPGLDEKPAEPQKEPRAEQEEK